MPFAADFELHGLDFSREMLRLAGKYSRKFHFSASLVLGDVTRLPYATASFDGAIAVATYHHLRPRDQGAAFQEMARVLKPGGEAFITVWNRWQPRFWSGGKEPTISWRTGDTILHRYYYLFSYREVEGLVRAGGLRVLRSFPEESYRFPLKLFSRNICLLVKKED